MRSRTKPQNFPKLGARMPNKKSPRRGAATGNEKSTMKSTSRTARVKRKRARRITKADRNAINLLYGQPESHEQDDDEAKPVNAGWLPCRGIAKERIGGQDA